MHFSFVIKGAATNDIIRISIIDQSAARFHDLIVESHCGTQAPSSGAQRNLTRFLEIVCLHFDWTELKLSGKEYL